MPAVPLRSNASIVPLVLALTASAAVHALAMSLLPAAPRVADERRAITVSLHSSASKRAGTAPAAVHSPGPDTAALPAPEPDSAPTAEVSPKPNDKPQAAPPQVLAGRTSAPSATLPVKPLNQPTATPPTAVKPAQARAAGNQRQPTQSAAKQPISKPATSTARSRPATTSPKRSAPAKPTHNSSSVANNQRPKASGQRPTAGTATPAAATSSGIATVTADGASRPPPRYPSRARRRGQQGRVVLLVQVGASGTVTRLQVSHSSGHRLLDRAALKTVKGWRFADHGGQRVRVPIVFRLEG